MQRRERDQPFQIVDQSGCDLFRGHVIGAAVNDPMSYRVEARQLQVLELLEQRIDSHF